jgi:hypothetical protein
MDVSKRREISAGTTCDLARGHFYGSLHRDLAATVIPSCILPNREGEFSDREKFSINQLGSNRYFDWRLARSDFGASAFE